jgi:hypothetical protein
MTSKNMNLPNSEIDEALWAAYRRDDKVAVMDYLFRRSLVGIGRSTSFPQLLINTVPKRRRSDPMRINAVAHQIPLRSRLN